MSEKKIELLQGLQNHLAQASSTGGKQKNRNVGGKKHEVPRRFDYRKGLGFEPPRKIEGNLVAGRSAVTALYDAILKIPFRF